MRRRKFITVMGSMAITGVGVTSAKSKPNREQNILTAEDRRIRDGVRKAFKEDGRQGVKEVLEDEGISHSVSTARNRIVNEEHKITSSNPVVYQEDESNITVSAWEMVEEGRVFAQTLVDLEGLLFRGSPLPTRDSQNVNDVIGISYSDSHWSKVGNPSKWSDNENRVSPVWYSGSLGGGGIAAEVDLNGPPSAATVAVETPLENLDGVAGQIWGTYNHTVAYDWGNNIDSVSAGKGPLSVTLDWGSKSYWDKYEVTDTDRIL
ncbi:hypothetical protein Halru_2279 [Halovivax ruber XH-70]|uniref:Uncharacterized protein n=1 Tax=Halovivax ruber (strain DSM 18193 / JCM 13892 / XH-70) TaxID=797302 RepID=L0IBD8_HALRX|nr:hypothetical protein [Halovivax ruber]AGB16865.1 hypothetical protein Halru_2279 [Halovivax ruber XH-70]